MCLTQNFIPNFQIDQSSNFLKQLIKPDYLISNSLNKVPGFYTGSFYVSNSSYDTFLKMEKFTKVI